MSRLTRPFPGRPPGSAGRRLDGVLAVLEASRGGSDLEHLYPRLLAGLMAAIPGAQAGSLLMRHDAYFRFKAAQGYPLHALAPVRLPIEAVLAPRQSIGGNLYRLVDPSGLSRYLGSQQDTAAVLEAGRTGEVVESLSGALEIGGELRGLVTVDRFGGRPFGSRDRRVLGLLAAQMAATVENALTAEKWRELDHLKAQFIASAQHELRTPITSVLGYSELLLESLPESLPAGAFARQALETLHREAEGLAGVVENLLHLEKLGRPDRLAPGGLDLEQVLLEVNVRFNDRARRKGVAYRAATGPLPRSRGDGEALRLALGALVENAVNYTQPGGRVEVTAGLEEAHLVVRVRDSGPGLHPAELERVFQPFYRVTDEPGVLSQRGSGVGLTVARHILREHGGDVNAYSEGPGQGSTFVASLPVGEAAEAVSPPEP